MGLINLSRKLVDIPSEPSSQGRVLKEISELNLSHTEQEVLKHIYKTILLVDTQKNRIDMISYLARLILDLPLSAIENPSTTGEIITHTKERWQSSRCKSLFTMNSGDTWYDVDNDTWTHHIYRWIYKNIFRSSKYAPDFITLRMMPYVSFPYIKNIKQSYLE